MRERRGNVCSVGNGRAAPAAGATLFERMANLSRGGRGKDDESDDGDDAASISIPRFLGRQNNQ